MYRTLQFSKIALKTEKKEDFIKVIRRCFLKIVNGLPYYLI
jgi:hypothetical protein